MSSGVISILYMSARSINILLLLLDVTRPRVEASILLPLLPHLSFLSRFASCLSSCCGPQPSNIFSISSILSPISSFLLNLPAALRRGCVGKKTMNSFRSGNRFQFKVDVVRHVLDFNHH